MSIILELIRITAIILLLGSLMGACMKLIYSSFGINLDYTSGAWLVGPAILILLFVLYRNNLQFSGFYKGTNKEKLPKKVGTSLIVCSVILLVLAPFFPYIEASVEGNLIFDSDYISDKQKKR